MEVKNKFDKQNWIEIPVDKPEEDEYSFKDWFWPVFLAVLTIAGAMAIYYYSDDLMAMNNTKKVYKTQYVKAIILQKTLDTRTNERKLVYRNDQNRVFIIDDDNLWNYAEAGDSVKVGYIEKELTSRVFSKVFHNIKFQSVKVIAKAKTPREITIFSSAEPDHNGGSTVIIPRSTR